MAPNTETKKVRSWGVFRGKNTFLEGIWSPRVVIKTNLKTSASPKKVEHFIGGQTKQKVSQSEVLMVWPSSSP